MRTLIFGLSMIFMLAATSAPGKNSPPLSVAAFLATHDRLSHSKKEMEIGYVTWAARLLIVTVQEAGRDAMARNAASLKAGTGPLFCPNRGPEGFIVGIEHLHAYLETVPIERRNMSMNAAMLGFAKWKYPCAHTPSRDQR